MAKAKYFSPDFYISWTSVVIAVSNMLIFFAFVQVLDFFLVGGLGVVRSRLISLFTNKKGFCKCVLIHKDIPPLVNPNIKKKQSNPQKIAVRFGKHLILKLSKKNNTIKLLLSAVLVGWLFVCLFVCLVV